MNEADHIPILFYVVATIAMGVFAYNLRPLLGLRVGKPERHRSLAALSQLRNGLVFGLGQRRTYSGRFPYAAVMHFLLAWGFIELFFATSVNFFVARGWFVQWLPGMDTPWFAALNDAGGLMLLAGLLMALTRRYWNKPEALPQDAFHGRGHLLGDTGILLLLLLLVVGGFLAEAARLAIEQPATASFSFVGDWISRAAPQATWVSAEPTLWWSHAFASLAFIAILPRTKMVHVLAAIANAALTDQARRGRVRPMHVAEAMEDPDADLENLSFGASQPGDFSWKQLLDSVSCTECARCTTVCPAHTVGRPLSPMKLVTDIRNDLYQKTAGRGEANDLLGGRIEEDELWSCTTCGACTEVCPVLIEHVPTFTDMRRHLVMAEERPPKQAVKSLEAMAKKRNPWGNPPRDRIKWATEAGLELPLMKDKGQAEVLYWVGCAGAYDPRNQEVARSMVRILQSAGVDFAVLGNEESCTGDSARRLGDEYVFEQLATRNVERLNHYDFDKIVTPCPHCFHTMSNEYPDFDGNYEVQHHTQFIDELIRSGKLNLRSTGGAFTYHDPCYLGRHNQVFDAPRNVLSAALGTEASLIEMEQSREKSFCCGAGGGNMWFEFDKGDHIHVERMRQAVATEAETVAVSCSFCMTMMEDASRLVDDAKDVKIRDVAEIVAEGLDDPEPQ